MRGKERGRKLGRRARKSELRGAGSDTETLDHFLSRSPNVSLHPTTRLARPVSQTLKSFSLSSCVWISTMFLIYLMLLPVSVPVSRREGRAEGEGGCEWRE